jgi:hypothetical protein
MAEALDFARNLTKKRRVMAELKKRLNHEVIQAIDVEDVPYIESGQFHIG